MPAFRASPAATSRRALRLRRRLAVLALLLGAPLSGHAEPATPDTATDAESWFVTAGGARIETPELDGLDCERMRALLDAIDASGYREGAPKPQHEADMALFDYENRLSAAFYADCVRAHAENAVPHAAFAAGYEPTGQ